MNVFARLRALLLPRRRTAVPDPLLIEMRCRTVEHEARLRALLAEEMDVLTGTGEGRRRSG